MKRRLRFTLESKKNTSEALENWKSFFERVNILKHHVIDNEDSKKKHLGINSSKDSNYLKNLSISAIEYMQMKTLFATAMSDFLRMKF